MRLSPYALFALIATLCACQSPPSKGPHSYPHIGTIERLSPALDEVLPADAAIELLDSGFVWSEGPVWVEKGEYLLFSDVPENKIYRWREGTRSEVYLEPAGYTGPDSTGHEGSNGLILDAQGHLVVCQHGDRRMARMQAPIEEPQPLFETLADNYQGKRFNSPNDGCYDAKGNLYFTDPPYGLPGQDDDPAKELPFNGVYRLDADGQIHLLIDSLSRPNGIALSPDGQTLYVANSDPAHAVWVAYDIRDEGLANGRVFYDATDAVGPEFNGLPDGLKVTPQGIIFATGPGAVYVFDSTGSLLGRIITGRANSNCALGNGGRALYITSDDYLTRVWLK
ncbi:MAG: gluconolactonase [Saprospiraceae bacterium]|nr:MAG: gluconolactonase [Saprospiraceae bacterium]